MNFFTFYENFREEKIGITSFDLNRNDLQGFSVISKTMDDILFFLTKKKNALRFIYDKEELVSNFFFTILNLFQSHLQSHCQSHLQSQIQTQHLTMMETTNSSGLPSPEEKNLLLKENNEFCSYYLGSGYISRTRKIGFQLLLPFENNRPNKLMSINHQEVVVTPTTTSSFGFQTNIEDKSKNEIQKLFNQSIYFYLLFHDKNAETNTETNVETNDVLLFSYDECIRKIVIYFLTFEIYHHAFHHVELCKTMYKNDFSISLPPTIFLVFRNCFESLNLAEFLMQIEAHFDSLIRSRIESIDHMFLLRKENTNNDDKINNTGKLSISDIRTLLKMKKGINKNSDKYKEMQKKIIWKKLDVYERIIQSERDMLHRFFFAHESILQFVLRRIENESLDCLTIQSFHGIFLPLLSRPAFLRNRFVLSFQDIWQKDIKTNLKEECKSLHVNSKSYVDFQLKQLFLQKFPLEEFNFNTNYYRFWFTISLVELNRFVEARQERLSILLHNNPQPIVFLKEKNLIQENVDMEQKEFRDLNALLALKKIFNIESDSFMDGFTLLLKKKFQFYFSNNLKRKLKTQFDCRLQIITIWKSKEGESMVNMETDSIYSFFMNDNQDILKFHIKLEIDNMKKYCIPHHEELSERLKFMLFTFLDMFKTNEWQDVQFFSYLFFNIVVEDCCQSFSSKEAILQVFLTKLKIYVSNHDFYSYPKLDRSKKLMSLHIKKQWEMKLNEEWWFFLKKAEKVYLKYDKPVDQISTFHKKLLARVDFFQKDDFLFQLLL